MATATLARPAERVAILSMALVFLCGIAVGLLLMSYWVHPGLHGAPRAGDGMSMSIREWKQELVLTDDQTRKLTSILDDFSRYYDNLMADGNTRIMQILTPEQQSKYNQMIAKHKRQQ